MEAIILAGGLGTRLRNVVSDVPKPMAPVNDKPFLYYIFQWLQKYQVTRVVISAGYKSETIVKYFGTIWGTLTIEYAIEEKPLGTGGAVMFALSRMTEKNILILNGDTYFPVNLNRFYNSHLYHRNSITIALKRMQKFERYGSVECRNNSVIKFNEKKYCSDGLINGGIYLINKNILESRKLPEVFSFEKEILEKDAGSAAIRGLKFNNSFVDIGVPEDYQRAKLILADIG